MVSRFFVRPDHKLKADPIGGVILGKAGIFDAHLFSFFIEPHECRRFPGTDVQGPTLYPPPPIPGLIDLIAVLVGYREEDFREPFPRTRYKKVLTSISTSDVMSRRPKLPNDI